jgi:hypothetical protein
MAFCNLAKTLSLAAVSLDGGVVQFQWIAADVTAFESGSPYAGAHSLDDEVALKLCDGADDDYDGPAQRTASVDLFAETGELDAYPVQVVEHIEEVTSGACDAAARPDQHDAEAAATGVSHHLIETRPFGLRATDPVSILIDDLEAALRSHLTQVIELCLRMLVDGVHSQVKGGALHARLPFGFGADPYLAT